MFNLIVSGNGSCLGKRRRSALAAAIQARHEYVLPARFDATELPGLKPSIFYIDLAEKTSEKLGGNDH